MFNLRRLYSRVKEGASNPVNGEMSLVQILDRLIDHGCKDVSAQLKRRRISPLPVSTGGAGNIYKESLIDKTKVAIKCLRLKVGSSVESQEDLRRAAHELYVWSKCQHPNILELIGVAVFCGQIAMVSPWMERGTVTWYVGQNPLVDRYDLCVQIGEGVTYLHGNNFFIVPGSQVHGDLKGANILVSEDGVPKITDFGTTSISKYTLQFDKTTGLPGMTLRWATYLEIITGAEPYCDVTDQAVMWKIVQKVYPTRPTEHMLIGITCYDKMWSLLEACWSYDPHDRPVALELHDQMKSIAPREPNYESISDVLEALGSFGFNDYTKMLESSCKVALLESYADHDIFLATLYGATQYQFRCPRNERFDKPFGAAQYVVRELYIWSKCKHPNVSQPFGVAEYCGRLAIIYPPFTRAYDGYLGVYPKADRLQLCIQLADAVTYLHSRSIIHGNLSDFNILVSEKGKTFLEDFSNAVLDWNGAPFLKNNPTKCHYLAPCDAPERYEGQGVPTREADVWALGNVIMTVITLQTPLYSARVYTPPPPPCPTPAELQNLRGEKLWTLLQKCWSTSPHNRPSALKVLNELKEIANMPSSQDQSEFWVL